MGNAMKFVFCEGKDDVKVLNALANELKLNLKIEHFNGKRNLSNFLKSIQTRPEFTRQEVISFAVIRDADDSAVSAFASVRDTLGRNQFHPPDIQGTFSQSSPNVGVFIVGVDGKGMIED